MPVHNSFLNAMIALSAGAPCHDGANVEPAEAVDPACPPAGPEAVKLGNFGQYRAWIDSFDPDAPAPPGRNKIHVPKEDWSNHFTRTAGPTQFEVAVRTFFETFARREGFSVVLVIDWTRNALRRIEIAAGRMAEPAIIWLNEKEGVT